MSNLNRIVMRKDWVLVREADGTFVRVGDKVTDFRGDKATVQGGTPPHKSSSAGFVITTEVDDVENTYYATVYELKWKRAEPSLEDTVERVKREIKEDVASGRVPRSVEGFSDLHDHVDANCYGGFCEDEVADKLIEHFGGRDEDHGMPDGFIGFINTVQDAADAWIREGGLRHTN